MFGVFGIGVLVVVGLVGIVFCFVGIGSLVRLELVFAAALVLRLFPESRSFLFFGIVLSFAFLPVL